MEMKWCKFCHLRDFKPSQVPRVYFVKSQWEDLEGKDGVSLPFLVYRGFFLIYFIVCISSSLSRIQNANEARNWMVTATNWTFSTQTLYAGFFFTILLVRFCREKYGAKSNSDSQSQSASRDKVMDIIQFESDPLDIENQVRNPHPHQCQVQPHAVKMSTKLDAVVWILLSVSGTIPYIISIGYWSFVYGPEEIRNTTVGRTLTVHGINAVLSLVDTFVIAIPVRIAHSVYTVFFVLIYALFTCVYEYAGGSYKIVGRPFIYSPLNWREKPGRAVLSCVGALVAAFLLHILFWSLYKLRLFIVSKFKGK